MRVFEVVLRSGAKVELMAEMVHDDVEHDSKIVFYSDKGLKKIVAYFNRSDVAGIVFGPDSGSTLPPRK